MMILKDEKNNSKQGESDINRIIEEKYNEIKQELENYNKTQKTNFKGLESIIEVMIKIKIIKRNKFQW